MEPFDTTDDHRVAFDFEVLFSNGGGIKGWDFRLDIAGTDITDDDLGDHIVRDMRLLMVGEVRILNKRVFRERHKRAASHPAAKPADSAASEARLIELSHVIRDGQATYPGLPAPAITDHLSHDSSRGRYAEGVTFQIGRIDTVANAGTAIDAPYHRFPGKPDVAELPLASFAGLDGVVVRLTGMEGRAVSRHALLPALGDVRGRAVLVETGWSSRWGTTAYFEGHAFLSGDAAELLRDMGAALVGIDSLNIDDTSDPERPSHTILLGAGIPIVENLTDLATLPLAGFQFSAAPVRAAGMGAFPVRAWARVQA